MNAGQIASGGVKLLMPVLIAWHLYSKQKVFIDLNSEHFLHFYFILCLLRDPIIEELYY